MCKEANYIALLLNVDTYICMYYMYTVLVTFDIYMYPMFVRASVLMQ